MWFIYPKIAVSKFLKARHCEEERRSRSVSEGLSNPKILRLLRFARNDDLTGLKSLKPMWRVLVCTR